MTRANSVPTLIASLVLAMLLPAAVDHAAAQAMWLDDPGFEFVEADTAEGGAIYRFRVTYFDTECSGPVDYFDPGIPVPWDPPPEADEMHVRKAVDDSNQVHIAWMRHLQMPPRWEIYYAELAWNGTILAGPTQISDVDSRDSMYPALALDSSGDAHVVWASQNPSGVWDIFYSKIQDDTGLDLTGPDVRLSSLDGMDSGRALADPLDHETGASYIEHPDVAVDFGDTVHVVWSDARDTADWEVYYQQQSNAAIPAVLINDLRVSDDDGIDSQCPAVAIGEIKSVHIAWQDARDTADWEVYYQQQTSGGTVTVPDARRSGPNDGFNSAMPDIDVENGLGVDTYVHIVFMDQRDEDPGHEGEETHYPDHWEIYTTILRSNGTTNGWGVPKRQSDMYGGSKYGTYTDTLDCNSMYPQIVVEDDHYEGNTHFAWHDQRHSDGSPPENWEIYHSEVHNWCNNPETDIRVSQDQAIDLYPSIALNNPHLSSGRDPDIKWQTDRLGPWRIMNAGRTRDEWITLFLTGGGSGTIGYDMYPNPHDLDPWDGIEYTVGLPLLEDAYTYYITAQNCAGTPAGTDTLLGPGSTGVDDPDHGVELPCLALAQNDPNPFAASSTIRYALPTASNVTLVIYDLAGRRVRTVVDGREPAGDRIAHWDGRNDDGVEVSSGVYLCRLEAAGAVRTRKMVLLR